MASRGWDTVSQLSAPAELDDLNLLSGLILSLDFDLVCGCSACDWLFCVFSSQRSKGECCRSSLNVQRWWTAEIFYTLLEAECFLQLFFPLHKLANLFFWEMIKQIFWPSAPTEMKGSFSVRLIRTILFLIIALWVSCYVALSKGGFLFLTSAG